MAFFFNKFPKTDYGFINDLKTTKKVVNILTAFFLKRMGFNRSLMYSSYVIKDNDTPESLSNTFYNSPMHYWACLLVNNIINPYTEWAMSSDILEKFVAKKYKEGQKMALADGTFYTVPYSEGTEGIHHFINIKTGHIYDEVDDARYRELYQLNPVLIGENIIPVTNLSYESNLNIEKRQIYLINHKHITSFEEDFGKMLTGSKS